MFHPFNQTAPLSPFRAHISTLMSNHHAMSERIHTLEATVAHQNSLIQKIVAEQDRI